MIRSLLNLAGIAALLAGLLFMGQGMGWVPWPEASAMIGDREWVTRGLMLAVAGAAIILISRRMGE